MKKIIQVGIVLTLLVAMSSIGFAAKAKVLQKNAAISSVQSINKITQQDNADFNILNQTTYSVVITESGFVSSNTTAAKSFVVVAPSQVIPPQKQVTGYRIYQTSAFSDASVQYNINFGYQRKMANGKMTTLTTGQQVELFLSNAGMARGYVVHTSQFVLPINKGATLCPVQITLNGADQYENPTGTSSTATFNINITNAPSPKI